MEPKVHLVLLCLVLHTRVPEWHRYYVAILHPQNKKHILALKHVPTHWDPVYCYWVGSAAHTCGTFGIRLLFIRLCFAIIDLTTRIIIHCWMWLFTCALLSNRFGHASLLWSQFVILRKSTELTFSCNRRNTQIVQRKVISIHFLQLVNFLQTFDINPNRLWGKSNQVQSHQ